MNQRQRKRGAKVFNVRLKGPNFSHQDLSLVPNRVFFFFFENQDRGETTRREQLTGAHSDSEKIYARVTRPRVWERENRKREKKT